MGGNYEFAPLPRRAENCCGTARQRETAAAARTLGQSTPKRAAQHHVGVAVYPSCSIWLVAFLGACALSLWGGRKSGPAQPAVPLHALLYQEARGTGFVCVCVPGPQQHQPQTTINTSSSSFVSVDPSPGACLQQRANPLLPVVGRTRCRLSFDTCSSHSSTASSSPQQPVILLIPKRSVHFRTTLVLS